MKARLSTTGSAGASSGHGSAQKNVEFDPGCFTPATGNLLVKWRVYSLGLMQLASEEDFLGIYGFADKRVEEIHHYLSGENLRLRGKEEPFYERAREIYGDVLTVPIDCLALQMGGLPDQPRNPRIAIKKLQNEKGIAILHDFTRWSWDRLRRDLGDELTYWLDGWLRPLGIPLRRR